MDLRSIYVSNGVGIFILCILLYSSRTKILRQHVEDKIYAFLIYGVMLGCFMEALSYTVDGLIFPGSRVINYIANTYLFSFNLILPFSLLIYVDLGLYGDTERILKKYKPQIAVGAAMLILNIVNFFIPISYYINEQNVYERRPFSYVYYFVILYYCVSAMVLNKKYEKLNGTNTFFRINMFLVPILVGAGLQFLFYGLSLAWLSSAIGLCGMYMMQQNETAYLDSRVDTYNRQYLDRVMSAWINHGNSFDGAMVDIDRFKSINDSYGHSEGDRALVTIADILKNARITNEMVFRFAGDEFIILKMTRNEEGMTDYFDEVNRQLEKFNREQHKYPLIISYGVSHFTSGDIDGFMKEMDVRMYEMKEEHHKNESRGRFS